jgi:hypothetical protein
MAVSLCPSFNRTDLLDVMSHAGPSQHELSPIRDGLTRIVCWTVCLTSVVLSGCGGSNAKVSGTVTLDGKPVEGSPDLYGTVSFYREDGGGAPAVGIIGGGGHYDLATGSSEGLEPGSYRVAVSVKKILPPATPGGLTRPQRISPAKMGKPEESGLRADVKVGGNTFNFDLTSNSAK